MSIETIRRSYKPDHVNVLFIGESAPAGGTFFYYGNSSLTKYTAEGFLKAYKVKFSNNLEFINRYRENNYYLDDLSLIPANHMNRIDRREAWRSSVDSLSLRLKKYSPNAIISIMKAIEPYVKKAMKMAQTGDIPFYSLPFPAFSHHLEYMDKLSWTLSDLKERTIIGRKFL